MKPAAAPSVADIAFIFIAPIFSIAGAVRLTQSDGDLAAHVRMGRHIVSQHEIPDHSLASYTTAADQLVAPAWLSEVIFAALYGLGGLPLIAVTTGIIVGLTHTLVATFLRNRSVDPRLALGTALASLLVAAIHWLARPHMFSILGALLTLFLLESRGRNRIAAVFLLFSLWANLHGGWLYGLLMAAAYVAGDLIETRRGDRGEWMSRAKDDAAALGAALAGTLCNPYFLSLHREVARAVTSDSLAAFIDEYQPPAFTEPESLPFFLVVAAGAVLLLKGRRLPPAPWAIVIAMSTVFGFSASRNIALFAVTGLPLLALHLARTGTYSGDRFRYFGSIARVDASARAGAWAVIAAGLLLALGLNRGKAAGQSLIADRFDPEVFPVAAVERAKAAGVQGRIFHPWVWGGYLMHAWPGSSIHVDPLEFSQQTIDSHTVIEDVRRGWRGELARWKIDVVLVEPGSPVDDSLASDPGWTSWYRDSTAVVLRRRTLLDSRTTPGT